jgi:hypothetical protein
VQRRIVGAADVALLEYFSTAGETYVFVVRHDEVRVRALGLTLDDLAARVGAAIRPIREFVASRKTSDLFLPPERALRGTPGPGPRDGTGPPPPPGRVSRSPRRVGAGPQPCPPLLLGGIPGARTRGSRGAAPERGDELTRGRRPLTAPAAEGAPWST